MAAYRAILPRIDRWLAPGGYALLEIGAGQAPALRAVAERTGLAVAETRRDLAGVERCVVVRRFPIFTDT
jgi:release factor glutamine methyltransferase